MGILASNRHLYWDSVEPNICMFLMDKFYSQPFAFLHIIHDELRDLVI